MRWQEARRHTQRSGSTHSKDKGMGRGRDHTFGARRLSSTKPATATNCGTEKAPATAMSAASCSSTTLLPEK